MILLRHVPAPHLPKYPLYTAILHGCKVAAPFGHLSILKPRGQGVVPAFQQHPIPSGIHLAHCGSCILHICASPLLPNSPITGTDKHHLTAGPEAEGSMWGPGGAKSGLFP